MVAFGYNIPDEEYNMVMDECKKHHPRSQKQQEAFLAGYIYRRYKHFSSAYHQFGNQRFIWTYCDGEDFAQKCLDEVENKVNGNKN